MAVFSSFCQLDLKGTTQRQGRGQKGVDNRNNKNNRTRQSKQFESLNFNLETCSREEAGDDYGGDRGDKGDRDL